MPHSPLSSTQEVGENPKLNLAVETLGCRGTVRVKAWGTSMLPSLWPGDLLTIESIAHDAIIPGDIVLVLRDQRFFIHRLVETRRHENCISFVTKGDAMPNNDPPAAAPELLGRVAGVRRGNRSFVPSRQVSPVQSAVAWTLFRVQRFRNLIFGIKAASRKTPPLRSRQFVRGLWNERSEIPGATSSGGPH